MCGHLRPQVLRSGGGHGCRAAGQRGERARHAAGAAAAMRAVGLGGSIPFCLGGKGRLLIKFGRFPFHKAQRALGAVQTRAEAVTVDVADKFGFAVNDGKRALSAVEYALPAAVALFFVNLNDGTFHIMPPLPGAPAPRACR